MSVKRNKKVVVASLSFEGSSAQELSSTFSSIEHQAKEIEEVLSIYEGSGEKVGVLLLNLGGPESLDDVQPFLYNLFADPVQVVS
jgi:ferrochelatase